MVRSKGRKRKSDEDADPFWRIRFIDTAQFMMAPLDNLVKNLGNSTEQFPLTTAELQKNGVKEDHVPLLLSKGVYPYSYMDGWNKFNETALPSKDAFFNDLTGEDISDEAYDHATTVFNTLDMKNLGQYHDYYLLTDVLLLADVFESFRSSALVYYQLDPAHYWTIPSFAWDAFLLKSGVELELLQDADMYTFFEDGIRGGISMISHRYARANNNTFRSAMIHNSRRCLLFTWMLTISMVMRCQGSCQWGISSGWIMMILLGLGRMMSSLWMLMGTRGMCSR